MDESGLCVEVCRSWGWLGELVAFAALAARAIWVQRRKTVVERVNASLQQELSMRPPKPTPSLVQLEVPPEVLAALRPAAVPPAVPPLPAPSPRARPAMPLAPTNESETDDVR